MIVKFKPISDKDRTEVSHNLDHDLFLDQDLFSLLTYFKDTHI